MKIEQVLAILQNRVVTLNSLKSSATGSGDLEKVIQVENELSDTLDTIEKIKNTINTEGN